MNRNPSKLLGSLCAVLLVFFLGLGISPVSVKAMESEEAVTVYAAAQAAVRASEGSEEDDAAPVDAEVGEMLTDESQGGSANPGNAYDSDTAPPAETEVVDETDWALDYQSCPGDETCPIWPYVDAQTSDWYHQGMHFCLENNLVIGYQDGTLRPDSPATRAMLMVMLWRLNGSPHVSNMMSFQDIYMNAWYADAVSWAVSEDIIQGYNDAEFGPNDTITREQMAVILWRYAQRQGYAVGTSAELSAYQDASRVSDYAVRAMQWACGAGMVEGVPSTEGGVCLMPKNSTTRAQMVTMMTRFCMEVVAK